MIESEIEDRDVPHILQFYWQFCTFVERRKLRDTRVFLLFIKFEFKRLMKLLSKISATWYYFQNYCIYTKQFFKKILFSFQWKITRSIYTSTKRKQRKKKSLYKTDNDLSSKGDFYNYSSYVFNRQFVYNLSLNSKTRQFTVTLSFQ